MFAVDPERLARGGQQAEPGALAVERPGQLGRGVDDVLAVVDNDQEVLAREGIGQHLGDRPVGLFADAHGGGQRRGNLSLISNGGQVDKRSADRPIRDQSSRDGDGQAGLTRPTRTGDSHEGR